RRFESVRGLHEEPPNGQRQPPRMEAGPRLTVKSHLGPPLELGSSTTTSLQRDPDEQLPRNYRAEGRQRLLEASLASESDPQAFVVANRRAEDVRITGRIAGLTGVEVDADEVHLAEVRPAQIERWKRVGRWRIGVSRERPAEARIGAADSRRHDPRRGLGAAP